jgi:hypothetical protein
MQAKEIEERMRAIIFSGIQRGQEVGSKVEVKRSIFAGVVRVIAPLFDPYYVHWKRNDRIQPSKVQATVRAKSALFVSHHLSIQCIISACS